MIFNIYEKTLDALSWNTFRKHLDFTIPFFIGAVIGIFSFSQVVTYLITEHAMITYFAFIGLILGCVPMIYRKAEIGKIKPSYVVAFVIALACTLFLAYTNDSSYANKSLEELGGFSTAMFFWILLAGFVSAIALLIPGLSGSVILLMVGMYTVIIESVADFDFLIILPVGAGMVLGIATGARLIGTLMKNHHQVMYCAVLGLVIGSVFIIFPGFAANAYGALAIILAVVFAVLSYFLSKKERA